MVTKATTAATYKQRRFLTEERQHLNRITDEQRRWRRRLEGLTQGSAYLGVAMTAETPEDRNEWLEHASVYLIYDIAPRDDTSKQVAALKVDFNADKLAALHAECCRALATTRTHVRKMSAEWRRQIRAARAACTK
ncbi:hypothetical protein [Paraburkholderia tropica]|uniref:hypothetical protein n=1 Tax=Paraburkholderia tropica TaxID=92647 RepID=UPI002AB71470|nr:hypothetical protein [Paraburkholderia tropica]